MRELTLHRMATLIKLHLDEIGISQAEFARQTGVTEKHISRVLTHHNTASVSQLDYWAFVLGLRWELRLLRDTQPTQEKNQ